jgi:hypothetical protein
VALALLAPVWCCFWLLANVVKTLPDPMVRKLLRWHQARTNARPHDVRIPGNMDIPAYMLRWWHIMRNAYFNCYLHQVYRSDDDTALHDHPWWSFSIVLEGGYWEHTIAYGGIHKKVWCGPGSMTFRPRGSNAHRLELAPHNAADCVELDRDWYGEAPSTTIFITGPVLRRWGFHHTDQWVDAYDWDDYCRDRGIGGQKMAGYAEQVAKPRTIGNDG